MVTINFTQDVKGFLEVIQLIMEGDSTTTITIKSPYPLEQLHGIIGLYCAKKVDQYNEIENMDVPRVDKDLFYIYIGQQMLDYYIPNTYKIECGNVVDKSFKEYIIKKVVE